MFAITLTSTVQFSEKLRLVESRLSEKSKKPGLKRPKMASSITFHAATHRAIVEASCPPNMQGAPVQAKNEPQLLFLPCPGPENSPIGVANGPSLALATITPEQHIRQLTHQAP
jgi:hypothetical protein